MGPLEGEKQGVLGEARRKVPETICPQEGKEQDQNTLRGTGLRAERKEVSQQLPAACLRSLGHWPPSPPHGPGRRGPWSGICHRSKASGRLALCWEGPSRGNPIHEDLVWELTVWRGRSEGAKSLGQTVGFCRNLAWPLVQCVTSSSDVTSLSLGSLRRKPGQQQQETTECCEG